MANNYPIYGTLRDNSACQALNTGLFGAIKEKGNIGWVAATGEHSSDYWGTFAGVNLSLGRKTGYGSYGPKYALRGARVIEMSLNPETKRVSYDTWIRQEDGSVDKQEELNYPAEFAFTRATNCVGSETSNYAMKGMADLIPIKEESGWFPGLM